MEHATKEPRPKRLKTFRPWQVMNRYLYTVDHHGSEERPVRYTLEIDLVNGDNEVQVYSNGWLQSTHALPASISIAGGQLEVDASIYGVTRVHLVTVDGTERRLIPVTGTIEDRRRKLDRRHPMLSRVIGWTAIAILVVNLALAVPFGLEVVTELPKIQGLFGTFVSPIQLPAWANTSLMGAGILAASERALTLRRNKFLDAETIWTGL